MIVTLIGIVLLVAAIVCGVVGSGPSFALFIAGLICLSIGAALLFGEKAPGPGGFDGFWPPGGDGWF